MKAVIKYTPAFAAGMVVATCASALLLTLTRPRPLGLSPESLRLSVVILNGEDFVEVRGPAFNALGAHQYPVYSVSEDKITLRFFVTRVAFADTGSFQADWPLLISQHKFLSHRVRFTCKNRDGEEQFVATILRTNGGLAIEQINP